MDNQVAQLKKKIKNLQNQLCQRTRNYLYHFKKSPTKPTSNKKQFSTQTQNTQQVQQGVGNFEIQLEQNNLFNNVKVVSQQQVNKLNSENKNIKTSQLKAIDELNCFVLESNDLNQQLEVQNQNHKTEIDNLANQIRYMKEQLQKSQTPKNKNGLKIDFSTPQKFNHQLNLPCKEFQTVSEQSEIKSCAQSSKIMIESQHLSQQLKILKKQVKKLRAHLEYQIKASNQTKQALLISQQQNYKFRLQMQNLRKQIKILSGEMTQISPDKSQSYINFIQNDSSPSPMFRRVQSDGSEEAEQQVQRFKNQSQKYEQHISILEGVKRDYLKKLISSKEEIYRLKEQIQTLKLENKTLNTQLRTKPSNQQSQRSKQLNLIDGECNSQIVKSKVHEISNCLPLQKSQDLFLFKPDTIDDMVAMLDRILKFCKNIQKWQKQKIQNIQKQRSNLLKILSSILMKHPGTKHTISEQISQIQELKYLVNFLNKQPKRQINYPSQITISDQFTIDKNEIIQIS